MSLFFGLTFTSAKSLPRSHTLSSVLVRVQCSPASSERKTPPSFGASTSAYMREVSLDAIAKPMRPSPCSPVGSPSVNCRHVEPPSLDLYSPLVLPCHEPFSHGPCLAAHKTA